MTNRKRSRHDPQQRSLRRVVVLALIRKETGDRSGPQIGLRLLQIFPDSPNQKGFPEARLEPGQTYRNVMTYRFTTGQAAAPTQTR